MTEPPAFESYYGQPIVKAPPWKVDIPLYLFFGGLSGASAGLAFGARLADEDRLARSATFVALGAAAVSPVLLIRDLGRPDRFYNMLRVFKVTSPMSVGTWVLAGSFGLTGVAVASEVLGILPRVGLAAQAGAALLGLPLATYTGALLADTAVPAWHEARRELPFVFAGGAAASAGGAAAILAPPDEAGAARRLAVGGAVLELVAGTFMQRRLGALLSEPFRTGRAGRLTALSLSSTIGGAALVAIDGRGRMGRVAGGALLLAGSILDRLAIFAAGVQSTRDPKYTVVPQRRRLQARSDGRSPTGVRATPVAS